MRKKMFIIFLLLLLINITACNKKEEQDIPKPKEQINTKEENNNMKIEINGNEYTVELEENETVKEYLKKIPAEYNMKELNNNEKYIYLDYSLPTDSKNPNIINKGDLMLYGDNCLVLFYKTFKTNYSYTKIGHINNLPELGKDSILVKIYR